MVIEAVEPMERLLRSAPWRQDVEDQGYEFCYFDGVNEYFLAKEQSARRRFFEAPPNCFDEFRLSSTHRMLSPLVEEQTQGLERQRAEREALAKRAAELEKSLSDKALELAESLKQLREAGQREAESLQRLEESEEREAGAQARLRELEEALQQADGELTAARQRSASLEGELQALLNSRSWKATRPLRALLSLTKKGG